MTWWLNCRKTPLSWMMTVKGRSVHTASWADLNSYLFFFVKFIIPLTYTVCLRLVFTSDRVIVGVVIRSVEQYNVVKIKPTESEVEHWFCLWLHRLRSSENCIVRVASRSRRINQWQWLIQGLAIGWFFCLCPRLRQPSFHQIICDGVVNGIGRNGNILFLLTPILLSLCRRLQRIVFLGHSRTLIRDIQNKYGYDQFHQKRVSWSTYMYSAVVQVNKIYLHRRWV